MTLNIPSNDQIFFKDVDQTGIYSLLTNNYSWFSNDLSEDDIKSMYIPSLCSQNNTINVYVKLDHLEPTDPSNPVDPVDPMEPVDPAEPVDPVEPADPADPADRSHNIQTKLNNKPSTFQNFVKIVNDLSYSKKYTINIKIYHTGLYIYSGQTIHKWSLKALNIYSVEDNILNDDDLDNIETFWGELVNKCDTKLLEQMQECENTRSNLKSLYAQILQEKKSNKHWELKIMELKKMIQNIIF
jgi:hypothetical protein